MSEPRILCIAGKNNIAVNIAQTVQKDYPNIRLWGICNQNDNGENGFQRSFKSFCELNNIEIRSLNQVYEVENLIFLSLEFDKIIRPEKFKSKELYNIHFSYLPEYKGVYTSTLPILHGKSYSGVSLHRIERGIDTGEIIEQKKITIPLDMTAEELYFSYTENGIGLIQKYLHNIINNTCASYPQESQDSTYFSKSSIDYNNLSIDLRKTAFEIKKQIAAFMFPAFQIPKVKNHKVYRSEVLKTKSTEQPGELLKENDFTMEVSTIDYNILLHKYRLVDLCQTAVEGNLEQLQLFTDNGYDVTQRTQEGWDIAIIAAYNRNYAFLDFLIEELNWDINTRNRNGTTLAMYLMTAAEDDSDKIYLKHFLKKRNVHKEEKDYFNKTLLDYAREYNKVDWIKL